MSPDTTMQPETQQPDQPRYFGATRLDILREQLRGEEQWQAILSRLRDSTPAGCLVGDPSMLPLETATPPSGGEGEVRLTDPVTGGQKGSKPCQMAAIDAAALEELGKVAGYGARKYARFNYLAGYPWSWTLDAAYRHLLAAQAGEDRDPESGLLHAAHLAWHGLALCSFMLRQLGTDDRFKQEAPPTEESQGLTPVPAPTDGPLAWNDDDY